MARIEGVNSVVNEIEVLPVSPYDDRIRLQVLRALYGHPALDRYSLGAQPAIRIIVKRGDVTLEGVVNRALEKSIAKAAPRTTSSSCPTRTWRRPRRS